MAKKRRLMRRVYDEKNVKPQRIQHQFTDEERLKFERDQELIQKIYKLSKALFNSVSDRTDVSEYYRCLLQAIYIQTGKRSRHTFSGIISKIKLGRKNVSIYIMNVYWGNVYVSHHVVIKVPYSEYESNIEQGDFVIFTSLIDEYEDADNFGLYNFDLIRKIQYRGCTQIDFASTNIGMRAKYLSFYKKLQDLDYTAKNNIYHSLNDRLRSTGRLNPTIPFDEYITMIHSLYYRQIREHDLYSQIKNLIPNATDMNDIISIQLFVVWMTEVMKIKHPGYILCATTQFVLENTHYGQLPNIAYGLGVDTETLDDIDDHIFKPILDGRIYYCDELLEKFNNHWVNVDTFIFDDYDNIEY